MKNLKINPKILFIRTGALGDVIMTTPIIKRCYLERKGNCEIYVKTAYGSVYSNSPYVKKVLSPNDTSEIIFDLIYNLDWTYEKNNDRHVIDAYEQYVFGNISDIRYSEIWETDEDITDARKINSESKKYIVAHMRGINKNNSDQVAKIISEEIWQNTIIDILNKTDYKIYQIGGNSDLCFHGSDRLVDMRDLLTIHRLKALCETAECFLGTDSGLAHVAATSAVNMVLLYTLSKSEFFKPFRKSGSTKILTTKVDRQGCRINVSAGERFDFNNEIICRSSLSHLEISDEIIKLTNPIRAFE